MSPLSRTSGVTSWLFIEFLFLDFHIAHIIIEIRIRFIRMAWWPRPLSHSSHMCCSLSSSPVPSYFLQNEQEALSACLGILFQWDLHLGFPVIMHLAWSSSRGRTPGVLIPFSGFSFVGRRPVVSST